jgi:spore maturation protein CgeB
MRHGWTARAWTWHEAADVRVFHPIGDEACEGDLVWIGNWGDDERTAELNEFLIAPVRKLRSRARVHGVRYPDERDASSRKHESNTADGCRVSRRHGLTRSFERRCMLMHLHDADLAARLAAHGRRTIRARHTCAHRVDELLAIFAELRAALGRLAAA